MSEQRNVFAELNKINVNDHIEKKGKFSYLSWTYAVAELRKAAPDATWRVARFDGMPYLKTEVGYFVEVPVTVNGIELSQIHPVLDNNNRPIASPNAFQINTSIQRALVKSIALHGLGLYIYAGEDLPDIDGEDDIPVKSSANGDLTVKGNVVASSKPTEPSARDKAIQAAKEKAAAKAAEESGKQATEGRPPFEPDVQTGSVELINPAQTKAIGNMLNLIYRKKQLDDAEKNEFITSLLAPYGVSEVEKLTAEDAKVVITEINKAMKA